MRSDGLIFWRAALTSSEHRLESTVLTACTTALIDLPFFSELCAPSTYRRKTYVDEGEAIFPICTYEVVFALTVNYTSCTLIGKAAVETYQLTGIHLSARPLTLESYDKYTLLRICSALLFSNFVCVHLYIEVTAEMEEQTAYE